MLSADVAIPVVRAGGSVSSVIPAFGDGAVTQRQQLGASATSNTCLSARARRRPTRHRARGPAEAGPLLVRHGTPPPPGTKGWENGPRSVPLPENHCASETLLPNINEVHSVVRDDSPRRQRTTRRPAARARLQPPAALLAERPSEPRVLRWPRYGSNSGP